MNFRYAERCLYDYMGNVARLAVLRDDLRVMSTLLSSVSGQQYDGMPHSGGTGSPVASRLDKLEKAEGDIRRLARKVDPIRRMYDDLRSDFVLANSPRTVLRGILELFYFGGNTWSATARELGLGKSMFFVKRRELVNLAMRYLGA